MATAHKGSWPKALSHPVPLLFVLPVLLAAMLPPILLANLVSDQPTPVQDNKKAKVGSAPLQSSGSDPSRLLRELEATMDRFYRGGLPGEEEASAETKARALQNWIVAVNRELEAEGAALEQKKQEARELRAKIEDMDRLITAGQGEPGKPTAPESRNALIDKRNALVARHDALVFFYNLRREALIKIAEASRKETETRKTQIEKTRRTAQEKLIKYREWVDSGGELEFFRRVNRLYSGLRKGQRERPDNQESSAKVERLLQIRRELGQYAMRRRSAAKDGVLIVPATLAGQEECFLIVDTGANIVTVPSAFVEALNLTDRLGAEVVVAAASGIRVKGRELVIPSLFVSGFEARDVQAVMLDEPALGIDGCLGLSFLNRFSYHIETKPEPRLVLKPLNKEQPNPQSR
jgi:hypothetical protein